MEGGQGRVDGGETTIKEGGVNCVTDWVIVKGGGGSMAVPMEPLSGERGGGWAATAAATEVDMVGSANHVDSHGGRELRGCQSR